MGTDIHLYVEKLVDGAWVVVPPPERDLARWPKKEERERGWGPHGCMRDAFRECYRFGLDDEKAPESYSGGVSGPRVVVLDEAQAELLCAKPGVLDPVAFGQTYVRVSWVETYEEACVDFLGFVREIVVPLLGASGVRFVFGFDS